MTLSGPLRKVASKLMARFGGVATIRRVTTGVYNPITGNASQTIADTNVRGLLQDVNLREVNDLIQADDKKLTIAAADLTTPPTTADLVLIANVTHQIIALQVVEQDNAPITYELTLRA